MSASSRGSRRAPERTRRGRTRRRAAPGPAAGPDGARSRWRGLAGLLVLSLLGGAGYLWTRGGSVPHASSPSGPAVPDPPTGELEVPVQEILAQSRARVLAKPDSADAWAWYAGVLDAHLMYQDAVTCYRRAMELAPEDFRIAYNLGIVLELVGGRPEESVELFARVAEREPEYPPVFVRLAQHKIRMGDFEGAADACRRAIELDPDLLIARRLLGRCLIELGEFEQAAGELQRVAAASPGDGPTRATLAQALASLGDRAGAERCSEGASRLPDNLRLPDPIHVLVVKQGRSAQLALERADDNISNGQYTDAVEDLRIVLRTKADDPRVHDRLAECYARLGQAPLAERERAIVQRLHRSATGGP